MRSLEGGWHATNPKAKTSLLDMDLVDVTSVGGWEGEIYGVDDATLAPNLKEPVNGVKTLILQMAGLP